MRQTSQPSGAEKKEAMKQAFKANSSRSSRGGQDTQSAKAEKAEKADVSSKKPAGTSTSSLRYRPFNFFPLQSYDRTILKQFEWKYLRQEESSFFQCPLYLTL